MDALITVAKYMTRSVHTVAADQTLSAARNIMRTRRVRHLPVLEGRMLVGVLSDRELAAIEILPGSALLRVEDCMSPVTYVVAETTPLKWVAVDMALRKIDSALVTKGAQVVGVFTSVDALRALGDVLPGRTAVVGPEREIGRTR